MTEFKEVLEIEKKYQKSISSASNKFEKKVKKFNDDLKLNDELMKKDLIQELNSDLEKLSQKLTNNGEKKIETVKETTAKIIANANIEKAVSELVEGFKSGF